MLRRIGCDSPGYGRGDGFDNLKCYALKVAKFGGIQPTLDFYKWAREQGKVTWMGGMFDTGVSKRMHAAFATLPGMDLPADVSDFTEYLSTTPLCLLCSYMRENWF